jgi:hypothetical protein
VRKKMTQGWVVYGGKRHAEPQREMFSRSCEAKSDVRRGGEAPEEVVHSRAEAAVVQKEPLLEEARGLDGVDGLAQLEGLGVG